MGSILGATKRQVQADDGRWTLGDVRGHERTHAATQGVDCVIHLAALPSVPRSIQDPLTTNAVNVTGTRSVVLAARRGGEQAGGDDRARPRFAQAT